MSEPWNSIEPESGFSRPAIMRNVVVLPQPDGPSSPKNSPWATSRETSATARVVPKLREIFFNDRKDISQRHPHKIRVICGRFYLRPRISVSQYLNHSFPFLRKRSQS